MENIIDADTLINAVEDTIEVLHSHDLDGATFAEVKEAIEASALEVVGNNDSQLYKDVVTSVLDTIEDIDYGRVVGIDSQIN